ncbi:MAG: hypothetical protein IPL87_01335 [Candidatus Moraniibacteriota bacterium]|nr:MAG: hypothetical protein IPL87_01335 [Candidatus Moranbacteria bacterium]
MNEEIMARLEAQDKKLDDIFREIHKIRRQLFWKAVTSFVLFILPLVGLAALLPWFMDTFTSIVPVPNISNIEIR